MNQFLCTCTVQTVQQLYADLLQTSLRHKLNKESAIKVQTVRHTPRSEAYICYKVIKYKLAISIVNDTNTFNQCRNTQFV